MATTVYRTGADLALLTNRMNGLARPGPPRFSFARLSIRDPGSDRSVVRSCRLAGVGYLNFSSEQARATSSSPSVAGCCLILPFSTSLLRPALLQTLLCNPPVQLLLSFFLSLSPSPLNLGGAISPPKFWGVACPKPLVLQCFLGAAPLNFGGETATP